MFFLVSRSLTPYFTNNKEDKQASIPVNFDELRYPEPEYDLYEDDDYEYYFRVSKNLKFVTAKRRNYILDHLTMMFSARRYS